MTREELHNFIHFMVHNKSLTREQQVRRNKLLENLAIPSDLTDDKSDGEKPIFVQLSAFDTFNFLSGFNDPMKLKYLTHDFDYGVEDGRPTTWAKLVEQIESLRKEQSKNHSLPKSLWYLFKSFIKGGNAWLDNYGNPHNSYISNPEWMNWCEENNLHPLRHSEFQKEIISFKQATRIRNNLGDLVSQISRSTDLTIETKKLSAADFYTNSLIVYSALERILQCTMKPYAKDYPHISVSFSRETIGERRLHVITILQEGSNSNKSLQDAISRLNTSIESGDFGSIREKLNGYCIWSVESCWDGEPKRWNILKEPTSETPEVEDIDINNIKGFTHVLKFYQS